MDGRQLRDQGMDRVDLAESPLWKDKADRWVETRPQGMRFTAEDLCAAVGRPSRINAVGARLSALSRRGIVRSVGYAETRRPSRHANPDRIWERTGKESRERYVTVSRDGKPDQIIDRERARVESEDAVRRMDRERAGSAPRIAPGSLRIEFGQTLCRICGGSGGTVDRACWSCSGKGIGI